jgi:hypothetical protein
MSGLRRWPSRLRLGRFARARSPLAPRPRSGLGGLGDALKAVEDGVNAQWQQRVENDDAADGEQRKTVDR